MLKSAIATATTIIALNLSPLVFSAPPKVADATPENGALGVDPTTKEIRVKFDQPMSKDGMSVVGGGPKYPDIVGEPSWADDRTFVIRVKLKPNHDYWLSIDNAKFQNFRSAAGESAVPYPIQFRTGPIGGSKKSAASSTSGSTEDDANRRAVQTLKAAIHDHYSYKDRLSIDWEKQFATAEPSLAAAKSPTEFAQLAATMLSQAKDKHIWLQVNGETIPTYVNPAVVNANYHLLKNLVPQLKPRGRALASGVWDDGIGYIGIATWDKEKLGDGKELLDILHGLANSKALIIDVRANGGGAEPLAQLFAGCFVSEPHVYATDVYRDPTQPNGFTKPMERSITPTPGEHQYKGRVAVLSGPAVMSSNESFLLMMKQVPGAVIVGAQSQGSSGNPKPHDLGNGVIVFLPSWKDMTADGHELEGVGIRPDIPVAATADDFQSADPVLEAALAHLRKGGAM
jgi:C-terminal processing protease CtpA/Prc